jgi:hypothetical protein
MGAKILLFLSLFWLFNSSAIAQTCCSGGVPLSNNIGGLPPAEKGTLQFSLAYDINILKTLKDEEVKLDDNSRNRTTHTILLKSGYAISERLTVEALFSAVRQQRTISQGIFEDFTETTGLGDGVLMLHYEYLSKSSLQLAFGAGPKIPTGPSDLTNDNGITLNADLQPGSGAWDGILHHRITQTLNSRPSMAFTNLITYRITGVNHEYLGTQKYEFGDEYSIVIGASDQTVLLKQLLGYGLNLRYRNARQDKNNDQYLANTGGEWIFVTPSLSWQANSVTSIIINGEFPLYSRVTGTQLTPTYRLNLGVYLSFSLKRNQLFETKQ